MHVLAGLTIAVALFVGQAKSPVTTKPDPAFPLKPGDFIWHPERATEGPVVVIVSIPEQKAFVYRNGIRIGQSTVSTGRPGHATQTGVFTILQKDINHHSSTYNNAPMPYMERLTWDGIALHAGNLPGYPASHGCVRLPLEFSKLLFGVTAKSTTIVIADKSSAPEETLHPGLVLASANLEKSATAAALPEPAGGFDWQPEKASDGPLSILMSGGDRTVYVYRNGVLIGRSAMTVQNPERPLAAGVFVMLEGESTIPNTFVPGRPMPRWMVVSLPTENNELLKHDVVDRVRLPVAFSSKVFEVLTPGTTLMVTDRKATADTTPAARMTVLSTSDAPAGK